jgi:hypothetical protein
VGAVCVYDLAILGLSRHTYRLGVVRDGELGQHEYVLPVLHWSARMQSPNEFSGQQIYVLFALVGFFLSVLYVMLKFSRLR